MSKTRFALAGVVIGLVTLFSSTAAQAYPEPVITSPGGSAADGQVAPGESFTLTGTFGGTDCTTWTSSFTGQPGVNGGAGSGTSFSVTYTAPTEAGSHSVNITCAYDDGVAAPSTTAPVSYNAIALPQIPQTLTVSFPIVVGNPGAAAPGGASSDASGSNGVLPNTGGPALLTLFAGGALVAGGAGIAVARRRTAA